MALEGVSTFLGSIKEGFIVFAVLVDVNDLGTSEELHDHTSGNDGRYTEFHESSSIRSENYTHPVEWVGASGFGDTVERHLAANEVDEENCGSPDGSGLEWDVLRMN
jgi:hypothetical protein